MKASSNRKQFFQNSLPLVWHFARHFPFTRTFLWTAFLGTGAGLYGLSTIASEGLTLQVILLAMVTVVAGSFVAIYRPEIKFSPSYKPTETERFVIVLALVVVVAVSVPYIAFERVRFVNDFAANFITEVISIAVTVLVIDKLNKRQATEQQKQELILQMGSPDKGFAQEAVRKLRYYGWLRDDTLARAKLGEANLKNSYLPGSNLQGAYLWRVKLQNAQLGGINLQGARLEEARLQNAHLGNAKLNRAISWGANLRKAYLGDANLQQVHFWEVNLQESDLENANLQEAYLINSNLKHANLMAVDLRKAFLKGTNLRNAENIHTATFDTNTTLPNGDHWQDGYDLTIFTNPDHPNFWEPEWVKEQREQENNDASSE